MYDDIPTLLAEIAAGEDTFLELKEVVFKGNQVRFSGEDSASKDIGEVFVSLANTDGGVVVFGVRKDGAIVGIEADKREVLEQFVVSLSREQCVPPVEPLLDWIQLPDSAGAPRLCLRVEVPKARYYVHQTRDGRFLRRSGRHRETIRPETLGRLLTARGLTLPFEERPAVGAPFETIDFARFDAYYERRFGRPRASAVLPVERILENQKLAWRSDHDNYVPTSLGLLLFSADPSPWVRGAFVDIAAYDHAVADGSTLDAKTFKGPVPELVDRILDYFRASPLVPIASVKTDLGRLDRPAYSLRALQEAIVNALVHRDYEIAGSQVIVTLFPDRIEIANPGPLVNTLTPENLYEGCLPIRRNQLLAGALRDYQSPATGLHLMESRGEGFLNLVRESERLSGRRPQLTVTGTTVRLTVFAASK